MLLSKRPEMFLPDLWPSYFQSHRCEVWDLDGKKFIDCSNMGVGTNSLGYNNSEVDNSVRNVVQLGNEYPKLSEEVYLAEKLVEINPWADMVRFARTGGEANAIAIRIAKFNRIMTKLRSVDITAGMIGIYRLIIIMEMIFQHICCLD